MTLPTLVPEYQKRQTVEQLKVAVSTLTQGFQRMLIDEGVESLEDTQFFKSLPGGTQYPANIPQANEILKKYFSGIKVSCTSYTACMNDKKMKDAYKNTNYADSPYFWPLYEFPKGFGVNLYYLKSKAVDSPVGCDVVKANGGAYCRIMQSSWNGFWIDVNGNNPPNKNGIDRFAFILTDKGLLFPSHDRNWSTFMTGKPDTAWYIYSNPARLCPMSSAQAATGDNSYIACAARVIQDGWKINYYWSGAKK